MTGVQTCALPIYDFYPKQKNGVGIKTIRKYWDELWLMQKDLGLKITAKPADVEINVEKDMRGMYVECWSLAPELFTISIISPGGQSNPAGIPVQPQSGNYDFLLEGTKVTIDYSLTGRSSRDLLAFIRMENVVKGVWTIRFYPVKTINGIFHL